MFSAFAFQSTLDNFSLRVPFLWKFPLLSSLSRSRIIQVPLSLLTPHTLPPFQLSSCSPPPLVNCLYFTLSLSNATFCHRPSFELWSRFRPPPLFKTPPSFQLSSFHPLSFKPSISHTILFQALVSFEPHLSFQHLFPLNPSSFPPLPVSPDGAFMICAFWKQSRK